MNRVDLTVPVDEMEEIVGAVFQTMLGLDVKPARTFWTGRQDTVLAAVHMSGCWSGTIVLETSRRQAFRFAGLFMGIDPPGELNDDVRDVLGELVTEIAGNLKATIAPGEVLSMPSVVDGGDCALPICSGSELKRQAFLCDDDIFWVCRITAPPDAA